MRCLVCQHGFAGHITDGKNMFFSRAPLGIDFYKTPAVNFDRGVGQTQAGGIGASSDRQENLVENTRILIDIRAL